ncbi:MAG: zinc-finger-containing protein [Pseudomonadota bacterium]
MEIWCAGCQADVTPRLTDGREIYPHRPDLGSLPFWRCDTCGNFVGCHHKTKDRTRPLGCIPTPEIKSFRQRVHRLIDPLWKSKRMRRGTVYAKMADGLGVPEYHTADLATVDQARRALAVAEQIAAQGGNTR